METSDHFKNGATLKSHTSKKINQIQMKKILFILIGITFLFSSCAVHNGLTTNLNNHTTEVVLSKKNFKVIESVQGEAQAMYVFVATKKPSTKCLIFSVLSKY